METPILDSREEERSFQCVKLTGLGALVTATGITQLMHSGPSQAVEPRVGCNLFVFRTGNLSVRLIEVMNLN